MSEPPLRYFGAAVIVTDAEHLLVQRKTPGYPVEAYVGRLTLVGGFWSTPRDTSPRETITREIAEELRPEGIEAAVREHLDFFAGFDYRLPELDDERGPYWTRAYIFEADLSGEAMLEEASLTEGAAALVPLDGALGGELCWGHDHTLREWTAEREVDLGPLEGGTRSSRVVTREEPTRYRAVARGRLVHDPLGEAPDSAFFDDES